MTSQSNGLYKLGGLSFVISGVLFLAVTLLGIMAGPGVFDIIGSYPWLIGPVLVLVSQILFTAWFVAVGTRLYKLS